MTPTTPPPKRVEPLSRTSIARAALEMVDQDGVDRFSMRRLAELLGVTPMAVYHHFDNKAEILQAAADQVWIEVFEGYAPHDDPVEDLVRSYLRARHVFHRHSDLTPYAFAAPTTENAVHFAALGIAQVYERAGFVGRRAGEAYYVLASYTFGNALLHAERAMLDRQIRRPVSDLADLAVAPLPAGTGDAYESVREAMGHDDDLERFERGLRAVVAGLVADQPADRRAEASTPP